MTKYQSFKHWLFFKKRKAKTPTASPPEKPEMPDRVMNLATWSPTLAAEFNALCTMPVMRRALAVLYYEQPSGWPLRGQEINETQAALELGRKEGYADALAVITRMRHFHPPKTNDELEPTYEDPAI